MKRATFEIDMIRIGESGELEENFVTLPGLDLECDWNGFACPAFEKPQADTIMAAHNLQPGCFAEYDAETDTYTFHFGDALRAWDQIEPRDRVTEEYEGRTYEVNGESVKAYTIGAFAWCWFYAES